MTILVVGPDREARAGLMRVLRAELPASLRVLDAGKPQDALVLIEHLAIDCVVATADAVSGEWCDFVTQWAGDNDAKRELLFIVAPPAEDAAALFRLH